MKIRGLIIGVILTLPLIASGQSRVWHNGQPIFMSGMNLAWIDFADDLTNFNETQFTLAMDQISEAGGNTVRWWLHVNGAHSPVFTDNMVSGITETEKESLLQALDIAEEHKIGLILCLWSFDMLRTSFGETITSRNKLMLENETYLDAYINNALIPLVNYVGDHPAIVAWEVFNEPEGMSTTFGWSDIQHVSMANIQRFVNKVAGAIHRASPQALVSNGCWSFQAGSDISTYKNYYSDSQLIAAGGDDDGTLDFYMVHYYDWGGTAISPFHHPASYWELDKPLVIGEFSAKGPYEGIDPETAYKYLYDNGYAGALSWTWTNHDGNGGVADAAPGMTYLAEHYPSDIILPLPEFRIPFTGNSENRVVAYPLPADEFVSFRLEEQTEISAIDIYCLTGSLVKRACPVRSGSDDIQINIQELAGGRYFVKIVADDKMFYSTFIKE
jgi:hypothetical protein